MSRLTFLFSLVIWQTFLFAGNGRFEEKPFAIQINDSYEYAVLNEFFHRGFLEEEDYGYVLEGVKPISIRNFQDIDSFLTPFYLDWELLAHEAISIWNRVCKQKQDFVFKQVNISDFESIAPGFELAFINIPHLKRVIEENLSLFRYVIEPDITSDELVNRIAYSDELLCDILKNDLTLVGIVLGFGLHNSLVGGKLDMISNRILSRDTPPLLPQHGLFQNPVKNDFIFPEEMYRLYYLEFAGGSDFPFRIRERANTTSSYFTLADLKALAKSKEKEELLPLSLQKENPRFIFGAFKGKESNQPLFQRLLSAQRSIQTLVKKDNFLEIVLEKIGGKKPIISCHRPSNPSQKPLLFKEREQEWGKLILHVAKRFKGKRQSAFIEAFCKPTETSRQRPWAVGVSEAALNGLIKARTNLAAADNQFAILAVKTPPQIQELIKGLLYIETTKEGAGKKITEKNDHIRIGYIVEDQEGTILFANNDLWLQISDTISGFSQGVQGMLIGEKRTIFIHPSIGYGALTTLPCCSSITIKVHLIDIDEETTFKGSMPQLHPIDLSWVKDPALYEKIESSLQQIPLFIGSFYRDWLDKKSGLNMASIIDQLKNSDREKPAILSAPTLL
jgi:hypothetical protein